MGEFLLLHRDHRVTKDVLLFRKLSLGVKYLKVKVIIGQHKNRFPGLDGGAFLDDDLLDGTAFERADLDCDHWLYLTAHTDIVVELSVSHLADRDRVLVNPEGLGIVSEHEVEHEHYHDGSEPVRHRLFCEG